MAVRLNVNANVTGTRQVNGLNRAVAGLGRGASVAATRLGTLEAAAVRGRASFSALGSALRIGVVAGFAAATFAATSFVRQTIEAGNLVERSRIQFNAFFGDVALGGQAFDTLNEFAGRVPFTLQEIIRGGTALAAISDGPLALGRNLEIVGNLAASANLDFATAALQYQRVASAGVAAADLLRDRGVTGLLGFVSGVQYTADESVRVFEEAFGRGGRFGDVTNQLAGTLAGNFSLVQDALFRFRAAVSEPLFEGLSEQITNLIGDFRNNDQALRELAETVGTRLATAFQNIENIIRFFGENINSISFAVRTFIAIGITRYIVGLAAAVRTLNVALLINPFVAIATAVGIAITSLTIYRKELEQIVGFFDRLRGDSSLATQVEQAEAGAAAEQERLEAVKAIVVERNRAIMLTTQQAAAQRNFQALANGEIVTLERKNQLEVAALGNYRNKVNFQRLINEGIAKEAETTATINRTIAEGANQRRMSFDELVRNAELEETNRLIREQEEEWMNVQDIIDNGASNAVNDLFDSVQGGESIFESLRNTALNALNDIARAAATNALSDILSGGQRSSGGSAVGGIGGIISGARRIFGFQNGGIVPGGAPYTDRVPALLTPGERVIPRDQVNNNNSTMSNITNINISGNVDQRAINMIKGVISTSSAEVGGANKQYTRNSAGLRNRRS